MTSPVNTAYTITEKPKILLVDDREENLIALERLLADLPVELHKATSGNDALKLILHHDFALALLDIQMPGMDGYELARILRDEARTARMPFIFISAIYKDNFNIFKGYEEGAFSYITKPFEPRVLINKVKFFIEKHEQEQALKNAQYILEQRVKERTADLERSNADLEQFAYVASHDLQEPLRMVTSYVQLLQRRYSDRLDKDANEFIDFAVDGTVRMKRLITDLLNYSRATRPAEQVAVDLNEVLTNVRENLRSAITASGALIKVGPLPTVKAERTGMLQLFQNLVSNAIKFRQEGQVPEVHVEATEEPGQWTFSVQDNGIGIDEQFAEKIFTLFHQLNDRSLYAGTGIGLAIARKVVQRAGGRIWFHSVPGEGALFRFTLPQPPT
jgi:signal transduction histidine kinase